MTATTEPSSVYAGDTVTWTKSLTDYPAPTYTLAYALVRDGGSISITASASGADHLVSVSAATSAAWVPGTYQWTAYVTSGSARYTVETGEIVIKPNPAAGGYDTRSYARRMLDAIEALLEGRATSDVSSYSIGGRSLSKMSALELVQWREKFRREAESEKAGERIARGLNTGRKILTRF